VGDIFAVSQGQVSFYLTSRYSFAQRQTSAASGRYAFDVRDGNGTHLFSFQTSIASVSSTPYLMFNYVVAGSNQYYYVPKGTEDQLFGNGVTLLVTLKWDGSKVYLYLNNTLMKTSAYTPPAPNWSAGSIFDLGAFEFQTFGGYNVTDDLVAEFTVN
jgi:hypothetical protein